MCVNYRQSKFLWIFYSTYNRKSVYHYTMTSYNLYNDIRPLRPKFWTEDPVQLLKCPLFPTRDGDDISNLNSITRIGVIVAVIMYFLKYKQWWQVLIVSISVPLVFYYLRPNRENLGYIDTYSQNTSNSHNASNSQNATEFATYKEVSIDDILGKQRDQAVADAIQSDQLLDNMSHKPLYTVPNSTIPLTRGDILEHRMHSNISSASEDTQTVNHPFMAEACKFQLDRVKNERKSIREYANMTSKLSGNLGTANIAYQTNDGIPIETTSNFCKTAASMYAIDNSNRSKSHMTSYAKTRFNNFKLTK